MQITANSNNIANFLIEWMKNFEKFLFSSAVELERETIKFNAQRRRDQDSNNHNSDDWFAFDRYHSGTEVWNSNLLYFLQLNSFRPLKYFTKNDKQNFQEFRNFIPI